MENNIYEKLNVNTFINAAGHFTKVGGSKMSEESLKNLREASHHNVDIRDLQSKVHKEVARLTKNDAAFICNGAATGLYLSIAACIQMKEGQPIKFMDFAEIHKKEVIMYKSHRNPYDWSVRQLGVQIKEIGYSNDIEDIDPRELEYAINEQTVGILYTAGSSKSWVPPGALSLEEVVEIAGKHNLPVIVDAAAQLPPKENLWRFTQRGANAVVFSGGKDLGGPQASGLIVGEEILLDHIRQIGFPNYGIGRMMKIGREEIIGLYSAVKQYVEHDEDARIDWCNEKVNFLIDSFRNSDLFTIEHRPNVAGQPIPRAIVIIKNTDRLTISELQERLMDEHPRVYTMAAEDGVFINTLSLRNNEMEVIVEKLKSIENNVTDTTDN